jgi:hypothetical protein
VPGTSDYSMITPEFAEALMEEVVDWMCDFVSKFENFEIQSLEVSKGKEMKELK